MKKGCPSNSLPKTFNDFFNRGLCSPIEKIIRSLGKGVRGITFLQKGLPRLIGNYINTNQGLAEVEKEEKWQ